MNIYRNKKTGAIIEIPSEFGSDEVWAKVSSSEPVVPEVKEEKEDMPEEKANDSAMSDGTTLKDDSDKSERPSFGSLFKKKDKKDDNK